MTLRFPGDFWSKGFHAAHQFPAPAKGFTTGSSFNLHNRNTPPNNKTIADDIEPVETIEYDLANVYIPDNYEPGYAYPLIVWLVLGKRNDVSLKSLMPQISTQNFLGMKFHAKPTNTTAFSSLVGEDDTEQFFADVETKLHADVCRLRSNFHIHSERVYLAGFDSAATASLELVLRRPEWFGGAIALGGSFPKMEFPLIRYRDLIGKRVFIGSHPHNSTTPDTELARFSRLLHAAGMNISTQPFNPTQKLTPDLLAGVNQWMVAGTCTANCV